MMACTSSIGPGANQHGDSGGGSARQPPCPVLLLAADTFASRFPDPVLQQVEHFHSPSVTVNDAFSRGLSLLGSRRASGADPAFAACTRSPRCSIRPIAGPLFLRSRRMHKAKRFDYPEIFFERAAASTASRTAGQKRAGAGGRAVEASCPPADHRRRRRALLVGLRGAAAFAQRRRNSGGGGRSLDAARWCTTTR
jgi:TPP-dependent trihydroxycyclohexane-1,2-dione (THcHDO) dehydratase